MHFINSGLDFIRTFRDAHPPADIKNHLLVIRTESHLRWNSTRKANDERHTWRFKEICAKFKHFAGWEKKKCSEVKATLRGGLINIVIVRMSYLRNQFNKNSSAQRVDRKTRDW